MYVFICVSEVAIQLSLTDFLSGERKRNCSLIRWLRLESVPIDSSAVEAWRRSGLQTTYAKAKVSECFGEFQRRRLAGAPALINPSARGNPTRLEGPRGGHNPL